MYGPLNYDPEPQPCEEAYGDGDWWYIDVPDLMALVALSDKYGKLIVRDDGEGAYATGHKTGIPVIEIYDDWRE